MNISLALVSPIFRSGYGADRCIKGIFFMSTSLATKCSTDLATKCSTDMEIYCTKLDILRGNRILDPDAIIII